MASPEGLLEPNGETIGFGPGGGRQHGFDQRPSLQDQQSLHPPGRRHTPGDRLPGG